MEATQPLYSTDSVRAIDRAAIGRCGIEAFELMTRAGAAALDALRRHWPGVHRVLVACGPGNNGGDGFVLARLAREAGLDVQVVMAREKPPGSDEARRARNEWIAGGGSIEVFDGHSLPPAELLVDALFGVGLSEPPREPEAELIAALQGHSAPVLALDVPSGVDADSGDVPGERLCASRTISFIAAKRGLYTGAALACAGVVELAGLDVPAAAFEGIPPSAWLWKPGQLAAMLPRRRADAHKGDFGHVLVVGGDHGMGGALRIAVEAALRVGPGLVSAATRARHVGAVLAARPECMVHAVESADELPAALVERADVLALGPGLGREDWGRALFERLATAGCPRVLDADALNLLAESPTRLPGAVLTPHPGEAARLLDSDAGAVQRDRFDAAHRLAGRFGAVVVLKGAGTVVAAPDRPPVLIAGGNPGMASGGMGDALTGTIAGLLAQGLSPFEAAAFGALLHAIAGDAAAEDGQRGLLASDLMPWIRRGANADAGL